MSTVTVNDAVFEELVLKSDLPVLVDYWAPWCGPCKMIAPILEEVAKEMSGKITVAKMNVEENPVVPSQYGIRNIPTLIIYKNGEPVSTQVGGVPKQKIVDWINSNL